VTFVVAHRGASRRAPENTVEGFRLAVELGADAVELDVHLTSDGQLAVIHDETLERTTGRPGRVAEMTMDAIREADAGATFSPAAEEHPFAGRGLTVPTLGEVLDWLPADIGLVIEVKPRAAADAVVAAVSEHAVRSDERLTVISFDEAAIERVRELDPWIRTGYLLVPSQPIEPALVWATEHGHLGVLPYEVDLGLDPLPILAQARAYGREVGCYVVNDPERMQHLAACRLWGFVTDQPDVAREALGPRTS
jgi:glycerophosphoryl diester phosphodiesterase